MGKQLSEVEPGGEIAVICVQQPGPGPAEQTSLVAGVGDETPPARDFRGLIGDRALERGIYGAVECPDVSETGLSGAGGGGGGLVTEPPCGGFGFAGPETG